MELFHIWLQDFNKKIKASNRKVLLFIDNCGAHNNIPYLSHVTVQFFPANTTSKLQPLDQGIIKNFKTLYRKEIIQKLILDIEKDKQISPVNLLDAVRFISKAWHNVADSTISNCFKKAGFPVDEHLNQVPLQNIDVQYQWQTVNNFLNNHNITSFDEYVNIDQDVVVSGKLSDDDIIELMQDDDDNICLENDVYEEPVSSNEVKMAMNHLRTFLERCENVNDEIFSALIKIDNVIDIKIQDNLRQKKITDYFLKM